jgi:hypothetical protein
LRSPWTNGELPASPNSRALGSFRQPVTRPSTASDLLHAARADLLRRLGSPVEAAKSYQRALKLVTNDTERRFLERRLREVQSPAV